MRYIICTMMVSLAITSFAQQLRTSVQSGNWTNKNTWDCNCVPSAADSVVIDSAHTVTFVATNVIRSLTVTTYGAINDNGLTNTITGHFIVDGIYGGTGVINLSGENTLIGGKGSITNTATNNITGNKIIPVTSELTKNEGNWVLSANTTITNFGTFTIGGSIVGTNTTSTWINSNSATLNVGGANVNGSPVLGIGTLHAADSGNTVNYYRTGAQTIKLPLLHNGYNAYFNLIASGNNNKTIPDGLVAVNGDLTIEATLNGNGNNKILHIRGNWTNNGGFTEGAGTVVFDGNTDQHLRSVAEERFHNLVINKSAGTLFIHNNITIGTASNNLTTVSTLTMQSGNIHTGDDKVILGKGTRTDEFYSGKLVWTSGTIVGELERWIYSVDFPPSPVLFPIGTEDHPRAVSLSLSGLVPDDSCGRISVRFNPSFPGNSGLPLSEDGVTVYNTFRDGYWTINTDGTIQNIDYAVALEGNGFSGFPIHSETRIVSRTSSSNAWALNGSHGPVTGNTVRRTNLSLLPVDFTFADTSDCGPPDPSLTIIGETSVCRNTSGEVYSVMLTDGNTYTWNVVGGAFSPSGLTTISGNDLATVTVDWGDTGMTGSLSVIEQNSCTAGPEIILPVTVHPLPPAFDLPFNPNTPQFGDPVSYSVTGPGLNNFNWTVTGDVISTSGQGTGTFTVSWGAAGPATLCVTGEHAVCGISAASCAEINVYTVVTSVRTGNWNTNNTWDCNCRPSQSVNVVIRNTHAVTLNAISNANHLTIQAGGVLNISTRTLNVSGDLNISGAMTGTSASGTVNLNGTGFLQGAGTISHVGPWNFNAIRTILPTTQIVKNSGIITLNDDVIITNYGSVTFGGPVKGKNSESTWINKAFAIFEVGDTLLATGTLAASEPGNTVVYSGANNQPVKVPFEEQYVNLSFTGAGTKVLAGNALIKVKGNWMNDAPFTSGPNSSVVFNGASSVSGSVSPQFHHLTLSTTDSLALAIEAVRVNGNVNFLNGSFRPNTSMIILEGGDDQSLNTQGNDVYDPGLSPGGRNIYSMRINKTGSSVSMTSPLSLLSNLDIQSPTTVNTNGNLIIRSRGPTTDLDASIGPVPAGSSITGNVTVERYMNPIGVTFRYLASPVMNALPPAVLGNRRFSYEYVSGNGGWQAQSPAEMWELGKGYSVRVPDGINEITWAVEGPVHTGTFEWELENEGWHLLGNPYPSAIRWFNSTEAWSMENVSTVIAVTDNTVSGYPDYFRYWAYDVEDHPDNWGSGPLQNGVVAMGQAFWSYAGEEGGTLTIHEPAKAGGLEGQFYRQKKVTPSRYLGIGLSDGKFTDHAFLKINTEATDGFDPLYDAMKLWNEETNVFLVDTDQQKLLMHTLPFLYEDVEIPLGIRVNTPGEYTLLFSYADRFPYPMLLLDKKEERVVKARDLPYRFIIHDASVPVTDRFFLVREQMPESNSRPFTVHVYPNPANGILKVESNSVEHAFYELADVTGKIVMRGVAAPAFEVDLEGLPDGLYLIRVVSGKEGVARRIVKKRGH